MRYVQLLKGRINFESTPEMGTRFDIFVSDIEFD
jgi:signal transduction histidine kinase